MGMGIEFSLEKPIDQINQLVWKWCDINRPDLANAGRWYEDGGLHDIIESLVDVVKGEV
jgi:hypothetical protein